MEKIAIFIQARTGSSRLPKKILKKIENKHMISHVINRVKQSNIKKIILLTTNLKEDKILEKISIQNKIDFFTGDEKNVLSRFNDCAKKFNVENIIRITGDCPLIDPLLINKMVKIYFKSNYDYISNTIKPTYPDGLDVEIFSKNSLIKASLEAKLKSEKEHVTPYIINHPEKFQLFNVKNNIDLSNLRWTVDEKSDLKFVRKIYKKMNPRLDFTTKDILRLLMNEPELKQINSYIKRNEGYKISRDMD